MITNHLDYRYAAHMALKLLKIEFWPYHSKLRYCRFESDLKIGDQLLYMRRPITLRTIEFQRSVSESGRCILYVSRATTQPVFAAG